MPLSPLKSEIGKKALRLSINSFFQGTSMSFTFFLLYAYGVDRFGFSPTEVAIAISLGGISSAVTQPLWGWLVDRAARRRRSLMLAGYLLSAIFIYWVYNSRASWEFYAAGAMLNSFMGLSNSAWLAILGDLTALEERGRISGVTSTFSTLGTAMFAPIAGMVMDTFGYWIASLVGVSQFLLAAGTVCLIPSGLPILPTTTIDNGGEIRSDHVEGSYRPFLIASVLWSLIWSLAWPLFSVAQIKVYGLSKAEIGLISTVANVTRLILQPVWGFVADRIGRKILLVMSPAFAAAIPFSYSLGSNLLHILIGTAVGMVGFSMYFVASPTYLLDASSPERRGSAVSTFNALTSLTNSVAPLIGGTLGDLLGVRETMLLLGFTRLFSSLFFVRIPETLRRERGGRRLWRRPPF